MPHTWLREPASNRFIAALPAIVEREVNYREPPAPSMASVIAPRVS